MRKLFSSSKSASSNSLLTPKSTRQLPPRQLPRLPPELQSHTPQQQQQPGPVQPWSVHRLNLLPPTLSKDAPSSDPPPSPFPRCGHALSAAANAAGELFLFGGAVHGSLCNDLYVFSTTDLSATLLKTSGEVPSPRARHICARIGDSLLIWGGGTNTDNQGRFIGPYNDSLYLLNLVSREWTRVVVNGPGPVGHFYSSATTVGSKLFVFGGQNHAGEFFNDTWAFDLNSLRSNSVWDSYEPAPGGEKPPPRTGHVLVTTGDQILLFGGFSGRHYYNDTWSFDVSTRKWTALQCTGCIPSPRAGHAAALIDGVMYVFGGRVDGAGVNDLLAFKLSTQRWFKFQNIGQSPSRRLCHAMSSDGTRVFVLGGRLSEIAQEDETAIIHVLDTKHLKYPNSDPSPVKSSEETTQLVWKSSTTPTTSPPTQGEDDNSKGSAEYRTKSAVPGASFEGEVAQSEHERQSSATLTALTKRDQRLAQLTVELREHEDRLLVQKSLVEQKDAELVDMRKKLDELLLSHCSRDQHVRVLEQALQEATSRAADADERCRLACERYENELAEVRAELGARNSELEAVQRLRLTDTENKSNKTEANTLLASTTAGLVRMDEERITRGIVERIRAEILSLWLSEKSSEAIQSRNEG